MPLVVVVCCGRVDVVHDLAHVACQWNRLSSDHICYCLFVRESRGSNEYDIIFFVFDETRACIEQ